MSSWIDCRRISSPPAPARPVSALYGGRLRRLGTSEVGLGGTTVGGTLGAGAPLRLVPAFLRTRILDRGPARERRGSSRRHHAHDLRGLRRNAAAERPQSLRQSTCPERCAVSATPAPPVER